MVKGSFENPVVHVLGKKNYYDILGISKKADKHAIKVAYHKLSLKIHPDRNKHPDATLAQQKLNAIRDTLLNKSKIKINWSYKTKTKPKPKAKPKTKTKKTRNRSTKNDDNYSQNKKNNTNNENNYKWDFSDSKYDSSTKSNAYNKNNFHSNNQRQRFTTKNDASEFLTKNEIRKMTNETNFKLGSKYAGNLTTYHQFINGSLITGSLDQYTMIIRIDSNGILAGSCSCNFTGEWCYHVVALGLSYIFHNENSE